MIAEQFSLAVDFYEKSGMEVTVRDMVEKTPEATPEQIVSALKIFKDSIAVLWANEFSVGEFQVLFQSLSGTEIDQDLIGRLTRTSLTAVNVASKQLEVDFGLKTPILN